MELIPFNGRFTIDGPNGVHKTFQIKTVKQGNLKGKRILAIMKGRENTDDASYKGFAFVTESDLIIWNKYRGLNGQKSEYEKLARMLANLIKQGDNSPLVAKGYRLLMEKKCRICNRTLTNPESIDSGIGPECRKARGL